MTNILHAFCHCGAVRLSLPAEAGGIIAAIARRCPALSMPSSWRSATRSGWMERPALVWHQSSADSRRAFCGSCGARVAKERTAVGRWLVSAGLIDGPTGRPIVRNLWAQSKPDWYARPEAPV